MVVFDFNDDKKIRRFTVAGLPGSGKTNMVKWLISGVNPRHRVVVWDPNKEYNKLPKNCDRYTPTNLKYGPAMLQELEMFMKKIVNGKKFARPRLIVFDEANMVFPTKKFLPGEMIRLININRHLKQNLLFVTRRPRSLHYDIVELSELILFQLSGVNDERYCDELKKGLGETVMKLAPYKSVYLDNRRDLIKLGRVPKMD